eukprot:6209832-Pleurochrysis_carterae.AAC.2
MGAGTCLEGEGAARRARVQVGEHEPQPLVAHALKFERKEPLVRRAALRAGAEGRGGSRSRMFRPKRRDQCKRAGADFGMNGQVTRPRARTARRTHLAELGQPRLLLKLALLIRCGAEKMKVGAALARQAATRDKAAAMCAHETPVYVEDLVECGPSLDRPGATYALGITLPVERP